MHELSSTFWEVFYPLSSSFYSNQSLRQLTVTPTTESFILIISALEGDAEVGLAVCDFINECLLKRTQALSENNEREILLRPEITITHSGRHSYRPAILDLQQSTRFSDLSNMIGLTPNLSPSGMLGPESPRVVVLLVIISYSRQLPHYLDVVYNA